MTNPVQYAASVSNGYLASPVTLLNTELNSIGIGSMSTLGSAIVNTTNLWLTCDVEFYTTSNFTPVAPASMWLWLLRSLDATNYEDGTSSVQPARGPDIIIPVRAGTSIQPRTIKSGLIIPPGQYKPIAMNNTGATLPGSGACFIRMGPWTIAQ